MDPLNNNGNRAETPADEDEDDDGEEHEQIRLVETPDPVIFSRMDISPNGHTNGDLYRDNVMTIDGGHTRKGQDFTSVQCQNEFYSKYLRSSNNKEPTLYLHEKWKHKCTFTPMQWIISIVPILSWLPRYNWKTDLAYDVAAGFTVAVMHIPQGMAYALLCNVEPIVGLYMAFYPVIMYSIMGTSRHISIGTFAVVCLMTGKVASEKALYYSMPYDEASDEVLSTDAENHTEIIINPLYTTEEIATAISLCVGFWQILMGVLQLGSLSVMLSSELVSAFTTGSAVHVLTSQMKSLLGLKMIRRTGIFKIPLTYVDIALGIREANVTAVVLSLVTISLLVIYNEFLKPILSKRIPFPIPVELITIVVGTLVSRYWITSSAFGISIVSHIPTGFPDAALPPLGIVPDILVDSLIIAIVAYAISISMAKIFATKHHYEVGPNQELIANGTSNIFGSFFSCAPIAASLSRSLIQEQVGGKTQLAGLFSCSILVFVLLWVGPFFETLPHCILSALIVVALKGMFMQIADLPKIFRQSYINGAIWVVTFLATIFLDIEYGLVTGLVITVSSLLWKSNTFQILEMGQHLQSNLFVERKEKSNMVTEIPGVKILKLTGNFNFATVDTFSNKANEILMKSQFYFRRKSSGKISGKKELFTTATNHFVKPSISTLVLDFSSVSSIDPAAVNCIRELYDTQQKQGVQVLFTSCPPTVLQVMEHCKFIEHVNVQYFFPCTENAIFHFEFIRRVNNDDNQNCN